MGVSNHRNKKAKTTRTSQAVRGHVAPQHSHNEGETHYAIVDDIVNEVTGSQWFSKMDLRSGYHQIKLAPESR